MKDLTKIYIDLSKCSEEQRKHIFSLLPDKPIDVSSPPEFHGNICLALSEKWMLINKSSFYNRTELTYPEFIKLFEGGDENNGWIKIESEADLPKEKGFYWVRNKNSAIELVQFCGGPESKDVAWRSWLITYSHYQIPIPPKF